MHAPSLFGRGVLLFFAALPGCAEEGASLRSRVDSIARTGVVGVQAVMTRDGVMERASAGVAELGDSRPIAPDSRFRIASTSKTFVATVTLQLVEEGVLGLDELVDEWLPGGVDGSITIRQLLQHTSGIHNHVDDLVRMLQEAGSPAAVDELLQRTWSAEQLVELAMMHPPKFAPGEGWAYSDTGYVLIGMIIHAATGETWGEQVERRIGAPLGLRRTFAPGDDPQIPGPLMRGYAGLPGREGPVDVTGINPSSLDAAAGLVSTPAEVDVFFAALLRGELLGDEMLAAMKSTVATDSALRYGLGLAWSQSACGGHWTHDGDTLGYHTRNAVSDDGERSVTVALSGDGEFEAEVSALIEAALCED